MIKNDSIKQKVLSFVLSGLVLFSTVPVDALASEGGESPKGVGPPTSTVTNSKPPTSLDDVTVPTVTQNPYDVDVFVESYPIYNEEMYRIITAYGRDIVGQYATHSLMPDGHSPYFTAAITPWYDYEFWIDRDDNMVIENNLPYREGRESILPVSDGRGSSMFHSELTLSNGGITVRPIHDFQHLNNDSCYKEILTGYLENILGLNPEQVSLRISATLVSGYGRIHVSSAESDAAYSVSEKVIDGKPVRMTLDVPIHELDLWTTIYFDTDYTVNSIMTDFALVLVDNTSPSVNSMKITREEREDHTADLVLTMQMNENLRFAHENVKNELDNIWVELELLDLSTNETSAARLYLQSFDGDRTLTFRGDIGLYNYKNFRVNRVIKASFAGANRRMEHAFVDLADEMYVSAYETHDYDNRLIRDDTLGGHFTSQWVTGICDFAGNPINASSITNWSFGNQSYISNTFEAVDVKLYNERTVGLAGGEEATEGASPLDMLAGPSNELFVYVYLDQHLTEEEAKLVSVELNIRNPDGSPLVVRSTSSTDYKINEVYGDTREGTLLRFENIPLYAGMRLDAEELSTTEPLIRVTKMTDEIDGKTAFANVIPPSNKLYADLTAPAVTIDVYAKEKHEPEADGQKAYYTASLAIQIEDVQNYSEIAGVRGTKAHFRMGGGVDRATGFRYLLSESSVPPENISEYIESTSKLVPDGMCPVGSATLINDSNTRYLHLLFESDEIYIDKLFIAVEAEDLAGNMTEVDPPDEIEYLIDETPPTASVTSQSMTATNGNTAVDVTVGISVTDRSTVTAVHYYRESDTAEGEEPVWIPLVIEPGKELQGQILLHYGGLDSESNRTYSDTLWLKTSDEFGNESRPIAHYVNLSLEKPATNASYEGNLNQVSTHPKITVTGPDASSHGDVGFTRVTVTPLDDPTYAYVTLVRTGETVDLLSFVGRPWYRVRIAQDTYTEVSLPETVTADGTITEESALYGLLRCYGELKISFENGYGDMTPTPGPLHAAANMGSYAADPNYYVVRFASPYLEGMTVHSVDFGAVVDRDGVTVVADADPGAAPYRFNQSRKGINPMRNTAVYFTLSNVAKADFGLLDLDYESSYVEMLRMGENGSEDTVVARRDGLSAGNAQLFMIGNQTDSGAPFTTGAYYIKVTVVSHSGRADTYESSRMVLDAQTPDSAGVWQYSYQTNVDITSIETDKGYAWVTRKAEDEAFDSLGISVKIGGEKMRSSVFAVYSYGVSGLSMIFTAPDTEASYEGIDVGGVLGFKVWNLASDPTLAEINAQPFAKDANSNYLSRTSGVDDIYTAESIPKGMDGFNDLYLMKGINTICYQVAMENGYVSPVRQMTVMVTDYTPELNIAIDDYKPSHEISQTEGVVNASRIRFFIETAYSLNGTGAVSVDLWSDYGMNVGVFSEGSLKDTFIEDPSPLNQSIGILKSGMKVEEYADFTENSYTSDFPRLQSLCTALFVATDEYGGVTIVAPQIGDHVRYGTWGGEAYYNEYNIDYDHYYGDPYTVGDSFTSKRIYYNQPVYFGKELLRFENSLYRNLGSGDEELIEITMVSDLELAHNLFNIVTNDVIWNNPRQDSRPESTVTTVSYDNGHNLGLINWDTATVTFSGGDLDSAVTLSLAGEDNTVGYVGASVGSVSGLTLRIANPRADAAHPAGTSVTRQYTIRCTNLSGDSFETGGTVTLYYIDYTVKAVTMREYGAELTLSFASREHGSTVRTGEFANGRYSAVVTDLYGNAVSLDYEVTNSMDPDTRITFSKITPTAGEVTVTLNRSDGVPIFVDVTDHGIMEVAGNNTPSVTVTLSESNRFSYRYLDAEGNEYMYFITVDSIQKPAPYLVWNYDEENVNKDENGNVYRYGSVTVYLVDDHFSLRDNYTGRAPSFTFVPGGEVSYTFEADDISALLGDESVKLPSDIVATLGILLYETPDPLGKKEEDRESPNVQLLAYSNLNGVYAEERLALQLENARHSTALTDYAGYDTLTFHGNRADTGELLEKLGWSSAYRFVIETVDMSKTRIFIKEGLYAEAPDYETGVSDSIEGVYLNSKLLTVTKNAKFSLFVVDAGGNSSSIAFDVTDVGAAPSPDVVKVPLSGDRIRAYVIAPTDAEDFEILGSVTVGYETDTASEYYGRPYVEYTDNDEYVVPYRMLYNGVTVESKINVTVGEINLREISLIGGIDWSANKNSEATNKEVVATLRFTDRVSEFFLLDSYDSEAVTFTVNGNTVIATYSANHPEMTLSFLSENRSAVTVTFGAVTNIDKTAPELEIVQRELAPNGKSVTVTIASNERAVIREGGFAGVEDNGRYYFTRTLTANGAYTFAFTDMTGLVSEISVEIDEIVTEELSSQYSLSPVGAAAVDDPAKLSVEVGDTVYVKPLRDVTATLSGGMTAVLSSNAWNSITVPDVLGGIQPYIILTDEYGNVLTHQFSKIAVPDTTAPDVVINKNVYSVRAGTSRTDVEKALLANFAAFDNEAGTLQLSVEFTENLTVTGVSAVRYKATDASGNTTVKEGRLRITSIYEPEVYYGEIKLSRDDGVIISHGDDIRLKVNCAGLSYRAVLKEGIKTTAQMKDGITELTDYTLSGELALGRLEKGIYTICIINQNRDYFRILISVE